MVIFRIGPNWREKNCRNNDGGGKLIKNDERQSLMLWDMVVAQIGLIKMESGLKA